MATLKKDYSTNLTIDAQGKVTGFDEYDGINARNYGSAELSITTQAVTGGEDGIDAYNSDDGTYLSITIQGTVTGGTDGIYARNFGSEGLTITANGDVTGNGGQGINAYNSENDVTASLIINQAVGTVTTGTANGIYADNSGGSLTINAFGTFIGQANDGIYALNRAGNTTTLTITITANVATGNDRGIGCRNYQAW